MAKADNASPSPPRVLRIGDMRISAAKIIEYGVERHEICYPEECPDDPSLAQFLFWRPRELRHKFRLVYVTYQVTLHESHTIRFYDDALLGDFTALYNEMRKYLNKHGSYEFKHKYSEHSRSIYYQIDDLPSYSNADNLDDLLATLDSFFGA